MDYNRLSYYRANPFAHNDFIPDSSMLNRSPKQFISQIPQGQQYHPSKPGKRIYKQKVFRDEIQQDNILQSPQKYPFENRIALDKNFSRNLHTIDIQGASSGTRINQIIKNKHKAIQQLKRNNQTHKDSMGESLDQIYAKQRRDLAQKIEKDILMRKTKQKFTDKITNTQQNPNKPTINRQNSNRQANNRSSLNSHQAQRQYERFIAHNSNKKYNGKAAQPEYQGYQRYKRVQNSLQTIDHYNSGRIPQSIPSQIINRSNSIQPKQPQQQSYAHYQDIQKSKTILSNSNIQTNNHTQMNNIQNNNIQMNNRYKSNPEYIDNYSREFNKRYQESQQDRHVVENIRTRIANNKTEFRKNNPTNLSFNIAARSSLLGPII